MRKLIAAGLFAALPLGVGCKHTGGECDCAPVPGDSVGYNAHVTYHATCPVGQVSHAPAPTTKPVSANLDFEAVAAPRSLPVEK